MGVLSLQGDFGRHLDTLRSIGQRPLDVRTPSELAQCSRLIIPGGESTTLGILLRKSGLDEEIRNRAAQGLPIWGTCMGMILMAQRVEQYEQFSLGLLDVVVRRNAWGAQVNSFEADVEFAGMQEPVHAVFIRAPAVTESGKGVTPLAWHDGNLVAVLQGKLFGTSFHPELTGDTRLHEFFLSL